jgi:hypothetical protein
VLKLLLMKSSPYDADALLTTLALRCCSQANLRNRGLFSEQGCLVAFASNLAGATIKVQLPLLVRCTCTYWPNVDIDSLKMQCTQLYNNLHPRRYCCDLLT